MAATWLLQALYQSLLTTGGSQTGSTVPGAHLLANTSTGTVRGAVDLGQGVPVARFLGVPFAEPPTGPLRFQPPVAAKSWAGVRDATTFGNECIQLDQPLYSIPYGPVTRSEDCLYLNVYSPTQGNGAASLPVMVWFHGGAYTVGTGNMYDGTSLAARGVVMVTVNYRLDAFGFLSTEDDVLPGNYGMLDQVAALKWVKANIAGFGGNPDMVTIFGQSAGSSSVSLLNLSPLATSLYRRSIMESGQSLALYAAYYPGERINPRTLARLVAVGVGCMNLDNSTALMGCLQTVDANQLLNVSATTTAALGVGVVWKPRVDGPTGFLPASPPRLLAQGRVNHVDTLRGFNVDEAGGTFATRANVKSLLVSYLPGFTDLDASYLADYIIKTSIPPTATGVDLQKAVADAVEDYYVIAPNVVEITETVRRVPDRSHYLYEFDHKPSRNNGISVTPAWVSAGHGDEIQFVFNASLKEFVDKYSSQQPSADDVVVSVQMMDMWTNFAKTGDPTSTIPPGAPVWKPFTLTQQNILHINTTSTLKQWSRPEIFGFYQEFIKLLDGEDSVSAGGIVG